MRPPDQFPADIHGHTRGKLYNYRSDGRCPECLVEACERQQTGGFAREVSRRTVLSGLTFGPLLRPACGDPAYAFQDDWAHSWTLFVQESGRS
jgi:hypothetical protein